MAEEDRVRDVLPPSTLPDEPPVLEPVKEEVKPDEPKDAKATGAEPEDTDDEDEKPGDAAPKVETGEDEQRIKRPGKYRRQIMRQEAQIEALTSTVRELTTALARPNAGDTQPKGESKTALKPPEEKDFEKFEDFVAAKARHEVREELATAEQARREAIHAERITEQAAAAKERLMEAASRYEDFEEVAFNPHVPVNEGMTQLMSASEKFGDIAYYLGSHPDEAKKIARMPLGAAALAIARIEDKFLNPPQPKTTSAPPPPKQVKAGDSPTKHPDKMSPEEYRKWRESGGK